jgi:hypothetical protein
MIVHAWNDAQAQEMIDTLSRHGYDSDRGRCDPVDGVGRDLDSE